MEVNHKKQNHVFYSDGLYGNKLRSWNSVKELLSDCPSGRVIPRYNGINGGANYPCYGTPITLEEVSQLAHEWISLGAERERLFWNEEAPDAFLTIQGEVIRDEHHLSLFYATEKTTMRKALQNGRQVEGLRAKMFLEYYLSPNSYSDIMELLDMFPNHVIEFSTYSVNLGHNRNRNTIIWEVRKY